MQRGWRRGLGGAAVVLAALLAPMLTAGSQGAQAAPQLAYLTEAGTTSVPIGWSDFCTRFATDCHTRPARVETLRLSRVIWSQIVSVNTHVNATIEPMTDMEQYGVEEFWTYPTSGKGDCEDYVLLKKQMLIRAGLPASALLITVVRDRQGDGHAVLTVKTDRGDYILDNENDEIRLWHATGYRFVKRQSQDDPNRWVTIGPASAPAAVASQ